MLYKDRLYYTTLQWTPTVINIEKGNISEEIRIKTSSHRSLPELQLWLSIYDIHSVVKP